MTNLDIEKRVIENKQNILNWIKINNRRPRKNGDNVEEDRLSNMLAYYASPSQIGFDPEFRKLVYSKFKLKMRVPAEKSKKSIIRWAEKHGRLPRRKSENVLERRYGYRLENYLSVKCSSFDPEFRDLIFSKFPRKANPKRDTDKKLRIKEILNFVLLNNRAPSIAVPEEKQLCRTVQNYTVPSSPLYSQSLVNKILKTDKCFKSGIQKKYRRCINEALLETEAKLKIEQNCVGQK